jgi:CHAT domain-containing protein/tetratricopeptide (TPR) repeat protein
MSIVPCRMLNTRMGWSVAALSWFVITIDPVVGAQPTSHVSEKPDSKMVERDQLWREAQKLKNDGKNELATAKGRKLLNLERELFSVDDQRVAATTNWLVRSYLRQNNIAAARSLRTEVLEIAERKHGRNHWRVIDAKLALADIDRAAKFTDTERKNLELADSLMLKEVDLDGAGKTRESIAVAKEELSIEVNLWGPNHPNVAATYTWIGSRHLELDEFEDAEKAFRKALDIQTQVLGAEHPETADALDDIAKLNNRMGNFPTAESQFKRVLEIRKKCLGPVHADTANSVKTLATFYEGRANYEESEKLYQQLLDIRKTSFGADSPITAESMVDLGVFYKLVRKYAEAEPLIQKAIAIRDKEFGPNDAITASYINDLASVYRLSYQLEKAEPLYLKALDVRRKAKGNDDYETAISLNNLGSLYSDTGQYDKAAPLYREALEIWKKRFGGRSSWVAKGSRNLAAACQSQGKYSEAQALYMDAMNIQKQLSGLNNPELAATAGELAGLYEAVGDYVSAMLLCEKSVEINERVLGKDRLETADSLLAFGNLCSSINDPRRAEPLLNRALAIRQKILGPKHASVIGILNSLAAVYLMIGDYQRAESLYAENLKAAESILGPRHPATATILSNLGKVKERLGKRQEGLQAIQQAYDIQSSCFAADRPETMSSSIDLASAYVAVGRYVEAAQLYKQVAETAKKELPSDSPRAQEIEMGFGMLYLKQHKNSEADRHFESATTIARRRLDWSFWALSERQQLLMTQDLRNCLDAWLSVVSVERTTDVYEVVLAWKGSILTNQRYIRSLSADAEYTSLRQQLELSTSRLAAVVSDKPSSDMISEWLNQIDRVTRQRELLEHELARKKRPIDQNRAQRIIKAADIQHLLPPNAVLIDVFAYNHLSEPIGETQTVESDPRAVAFVVKSTEAIQKIELGPMAPLVNAIDDWRKTYGIGSTGIAAGKVLREKLWDKLAPHIGQAQVVLVSPDGAFARFPWAAIPGRSANQYLIDSKSFVTVPAAQLLPQLLSEISSDDQPTLLLVGNVAYDASIDTQEAAPPMTRRYPLPPIDRKKYDPLPATKTEMDRIGKLFQKTYSRGTLLPLDAERATENAVRRDIIRARYLHFATHGFVTPRQPTTDHVPTELLFSGEAQVLEFHPGLRSGLVFAGANGRTTKTANEFTILDDGILTSLEISSIDLKRADLAVLSACQTGLGPTAEGEGLLGLQRSFHVAGAHSVLASLWRVDDVATEALMIEFYKNLWERKLGKLESLHQAQLSMMTRYDVASGRLRAGGTIQEGSSSALQKAQKELRSTTQAISPLYWAGFILSGDWR